MIKNMPQKSFILEQNVIYLLWPGYQVSSPCSIKQEDGCFLSFYVISSETNVTIIVQKTKSKK